MRRAVLACHVADHGHPRLHRQRAEAREEGVVEKVVFHHGCPASGRILRISSTSARSWRRPIAFLEATRSSGRKVKEAGGGGFKHLLRFPCVLEIKSLDARQKVDRARWDADDELKAGVREILLGDLDEWHSEFSESPGHPRSIFLGGADPEIEVFGETRLGIPDDRVATDDEVFDFMLFEQT